MAEQEQDFLSMSVRDFIAAVAAKTPTPGGGSVAGTVGALAVGLGEMALNFTRGKKKYAEHEPFYAHLGGRLERARRMCLDLVADDVSAYRLYQDATRLPDGSEKAEAVQLALAAAINVPRELSKLCLAVMDDLLGFCDKCNPYLVSDLAAGAALAAATLRLCDYNVRINVPQLSDRTAAGEIRQASADDLARGGRCLEQIESAAGKMMG